MYVARNIQLLTISISIILTDCNSFTSDPKLQHSNYLIHVIQWNNDSHPEVNPWFD